MARLYLAAVSLYLGLCQIIAPIPLSVLALFLFLLSRGHRDLLAALLYQLVVVLCFFGLIPDSRPRYQTNRGYHLEARRDVVHLCYPVQWDYSNGL